MELLYASEKLETICSDLKKAQKLFGGDKQLALNLKSRINALEQATVLNDIIVQPQFHFHNLINIKNKKYQGYFAIDVKTRKERWRIILQPLNDDKEPFNPCNIDKIAQIVKIIEISEVSNHYE